MNVALGQLLLSGGSTYSYHGSSSREQGESFLGKPPKQETGMIYFLM